MRFASLKSPNPAVRARLQAALFTNRKRNKERREASQTPVNSWGIGSVTVAYDVGNNSYGFNSYNNPVDGSIVSPNHSFPILLFEMNFGENTIYVDFQGDCVAVIGTASINIKGNVFPVNSASIFSGVTSCSFIATTGLISAADLGNTIPFFFTFSS